MLVKRYIAFFVFLLLGETAFTQTVSYEYRGFTFDEMIRPYLLRQKEYNQAIDAINELYGYITDVLGYDIDDQLRHEMNQDLNLLDKVAENLSETGHIGNAKNGCSIIYRNVQKEIANYNNRVAQERTRKADEERVRVDQNYTKPTNWSGTGFALKDKYVVTNYHIVDEAKSILIQGIKGDFTSRYNATVLATDRYNDLALLQISDKNFNGFGAIPYNVKTSISDVGEEVFVLGYPLTSTMGDEIKLTTGVISSKTGFQGDVSLYQISAPIQPGNSGGPLFDNNGNLIGIINAKHKGAENVGYAIKTSYLKNLIESSISTSILPSNNQIAGLPLTGKVKSLKNYVFRITCSNTGGSSTYSASPSTSTSIKTIEYPTVGRTLAGEKTKIKSVKLAKDYTAIEITSNNQSGNFYYGYLCIDRNTYILVNGTRYTLTRADGIEIAPEKTYFSYAGQDITFTLYFPPILGTATSMDLIEPGESSWKFYGIKVR